MWHRTDVKRIASKGRYKGKLREVIEPVWGPSIYQVLKETRAMERIEAHGLSRMRANLLRQVDRILRRRAIGIKSGRA